MITRPQTLLTMKKAIHITICIIFLTGCNLIPQKQPAKKITIAPEITGTWKLLTMKGIDASGHIHYPFDRQVDGLAVFDKQNNFSIQYYDAARSSMSHSDPYYCSDAEIRIAFLSGLSFFGTYDHNADTLTLKIKASGNPNLNNRIERRYCKMRGDTLLMIAPAKKLNAIFLQEHSVWKLVSK